MATEKRTLESSNTPLNASVFSAKLNSHFNSAEKNWCFSQIIQVIDHLSEMGACSYFGLSEFRTKFQVVDG